MGPSTVDDEDLTLGSCNFVNVNYAVLFAGEDLEATDCQFNSTVVGITVVDVDTIVLTDCHFFDNAMFAINVNASNAEVSEIDVNTCTFENGAGVYFSVPVNANSTFEGDIEHCQFDNITSAFAIEIVENNWSIEDTTVYNCNNGAISYTGSQNTSQLLVDTTDITAAGTGITFDAPGKFQIATGSSINTVDTNIIVKNPGTFKIGTDDDDTDNLILIGGIVNSVYVTSEAYFDGQLSGITSNNTGTIYFNVDPTANITITSWDVQNPSGLAFDLAGGIFGLNEVSVSGSVKLTGNGGAFSLNNGEFDFSGCSVTNASVTGNGGAIYSSGSKLNIGDHCILEENHADGYGGALFAANVGNATLSLKGATFKNNTAGAMGGAIDIESSSDTPVDVYLEEVDFDSNSAPTGAAISCCGSANCPANVTLVYDTDDEPTFENNVFTNADGKHVTCTVITGEFHTAASDPDVSTSNISDSSDSDWLMWLIIILAILLVVGLIVAAAVGIFFYRKRMTYEQMD